MSGTTWDEEFEQSDRSYSISNIQDYFQYIITKQDMHDKPPVEIYVKTIQKRVPFKTKSRYYLELLTPKTMVVLNKKITKDKNGDTSPRL